MRALGGATRVCVLDMAEAKRRALGEYTIYFDHRGSLPGCARIGAALDRGGSAPRARPAFRHAEATDSRAANVAALVTPLAGLEGRPSKSLTLPQAEALMRHRSSHGFTPTSCYAS